jgi:hypothetical protein
MASFEPARVLLTDGAREPRAAEAGDSADGFSGRLHGLSLVDVLQMFHLSRHTLTLHVSGAVAGKVFFDQGEVVHAECGELSGAPALVRLLRLRRGALESRPLADHPVTMTAPFGHVMLDSLRVVDEEARRSGFPARMSSRPRIVAASSELSFAEPRNPSPNPLLRRWLEERLPSAAVWLADLVTGEIDRVDTSEGAPDAGAARRALGTAFVLAERSDASWRHVEFVLDGLAVALIRRSTAVLGIARSVSGDEGLRQFRVDVNRLSRWWLTDGHHAE